MLLARGLPSIYQRYRVPLEGSIDGPVAVLMRPAVRTEKAGVKPTKDYVGVNMSEQDNSEELQKQGNIESRPTGALISRFINTVDSLTQDSERVASSIKHAVLPEEVAQSRLRATAPARAEGKTAVAQSALSPANFKITGNFNKSDLRIPQPGSPLLASRVTLSGPAGVKAAGHAAQTLLKSKPAALPGMTRSRVEPATLVEIQRLFPQYSESQLAAGRAAVEADLRAHRAVNAGGADLSVWQKLHSVGLNQLQLKTILNATAYLRENFARHRGPDGTIDSDQKSNWLHTIDELDEVLESIRGTEPERIVLAAMSMFGDSVKTKRNFMVHNLDGTLAWMLVGGRMKERFSEVEVSAIGEANKEHQIGPPELMARIYSSSIVGSLNAERSDILSLFSNKTLAEMSTQDRGNMLFLAGLKQLFDSRAQELAELQSRTDQLDESEQARLDFLTQRQLDGPFVSDEESVAIAGIYNKLAHPFDVPLVDTPTGGKSVRFEAREAALFRLTGNEYWYVPHDSTPWYHQSRIGIDADSKANYARIGGFRKLLHLNGPETDIFFQFPTLDDCLQSPRASYSQVWGIMTEQGREQAAARLAETDSAVLRAKAVTEKWLRTDLGLPEGEPMCSIPFWNCDLLYPERGDAEHEWWRINKTALCDRTLEEQTFWAAHRFDGLNEAQQQDYLLAIRIRDYMVDQLGCEQRLDGMAPGDFLPVMSNQEEP